jgi:hypothetical protein
VIFNTTLHLFSVDVLYGFTLSATSTPLGKGDVYREDEEKKDDDLTMNITQLNSSALRLPIWERRLFLMKY